MAAISGFLTAYLKIQDGGQTIELREHRVYMNLKSYALETFVLRDQFEFLYILLLLTLYVTLHHKTNKKSHGPVLCYG